MDIIVVTCGIQEKKSLKKDKIFSIQTKNPKGLKPAQSNNQINNEKDN